ncbi:MAG: SIMPL domain-containing protein [Vicinamibacterales bacterium]
MKILLAGLLILATAQLAPAQNLATDPPVVVVSGEGVVTVAPDQAWVRIGAETRSKNPKDAQAQNAAAMSAVQQRIAAAGIPKDAVRTVAVDLQMEYDYVNGKQTLKGYVARNSIEVRVDDLAKVGDVVDASVGSGATSLSGLRFDLKRRDTLEREALQRAVADAAARAEAAAAGAKRTIDRVIRIQESGQRLPYAPQPMAMRGVSEQVAVTPVSPGEIEIRAQVTLTATLK